MTDISILQARAVLKSELLSLNGLIISLNAQAGDPGTSPAAVADIKTRLQDMNLKYADLYRVYVKAKEDELLIKPPSQELVKKVSDLSDQVQIAIKGQAATDAMLNLAEQAVKIAGEIYKAK